MGWNDAYWKNRDGRKANAAAHHERMLQTKSKDITDSVNGTKIYSDKLDGAEEYTGSPESDRENTVLGRFIRSAIRQKEMLIRRVAESGNPLAGTLQERRKDR